MAIPDFGRSASVQCTSRWGGVLSSWSEPLSARPETVEAWETAELLGSCSWRNPLSSPTGRGDGACWSTVREYGRNLLVDRRESQPIHNRHVLYFLALAEEAEPKLREAEQRGCGLTGSR